MIVIKRKTTLTFEQQWCPYSVKVTQKNSRIFVGCDGKSIWKPIKGFDNYFVSNTGFVASCQKTKRSTKMVYLRQYDNGHGRMQVKLYKNGKGYALYVSRLVALAWVINENPLLKIIVHHIDGDPLNNSAQNLIWVTFIEHMLLHALIRKRVTA